MTSGGNNEFQGLVLNGVESLDQELGRGAYGRVYKVKYCERTCAAKEIHSILVEGVGDVEMRRTIDSFLRECRQCSRLRHPNVIQFLGVYYPEGGVGRMRLPVMVMEMMACSLTSLVNEQQNIPIHIKFSVINDVALGLCYLHNHNPPIVHRDLSPNNILLTAHYVAKISDLGVAKAIQADCRRTATMAPGTIDFMPPETFGRNPKYGSPMDVFSFAGIILHTFGQKWPTPSEQVQFDPTTRRRVALSEVERRGEFLNKMTGEAERLRPLVEQCLDDDPNVRPTMVVACERIQAVKDIFMAESSQDVIFLHRQLQELRDENDQLRNQLSSMTIQVTSQHQAVALDEEEPFREEAQLQGMEEQFQVMEEQLQVMEEHVQFQVIEVQPSKWKIESPPLLPALTSGRYHIRWTRLADLPIPLYCACTCAAVQGHKIYIAGYNSPNVNALPHVYEYDVTTDHWNQLPSPGQYYGVPHIIGGKLCIIGGRLCKTNRRTNQVVTFDEATHSWIFHYPNLLSARSGPGVITHLEHVIVAGGASGDDDYTVLDDIEILNWIKNLQWKKVLVRLPMPMFNLKLTISSDCIFIVGYGNAYRVWEKCIFKTEINAITISDTKHVGWDQVASLFQWNASPVPNSSPPLIVGGRDDRLTTIDIRIYDVAGNTWKTIGSLTFARSLPAVTMVGDNAIVVMGGHTDAHEFDSSSISFVEMGQVELLL